MKRDQAFRLMVTVAGVFLMTLAGCSTTRPSKFYQLQYIPGTHSLGPAGMLDPAIAVGLGPITLPDYLDRPQIVTRSQQNRVQLAEFDRWVGPLASDFSRVLAEDLTLLLRTDRVVQHPWPTSLDVTYQVLIDCFRFDGILGDRAELEVQWSVLGNRGRKVLLLKRSSVSEPAADATFEALVAAQGRALGKLSREIALTLLDLAQADLQPQ